MLPASHSLTQTTRSNVPWCLQCHDVVRHTYYSDIWGGLWVRINPFQMFSLTFAGFSVYFLLLGFIKIAGKWDNKWTAWPDVFRQAQSEKQQKCFGKKNNYFKYQFIAGGALLPLQYSISQSNKDLYLISFWHGNAQISIFSALVIIKWILHTIINIH